MSRLSLDTVAEMIGQLAATPNTPLSLSEASHRAAQIMMTELRELIATLPSNWPQRCVAWLRCNGPSGDDAITTGDVWRLEQWMKQSLLSLLDSPGGLVQEIVTPESQVDLAKLRKQCAYFNLLPHDDEQGTAAEVEPEPATIDPIDQCAADFRVLGSSDFRAKWMTRDTRPTYEHAVAEGKI